MSQSQRVHEIKTLQELFCNSLDLRHFEPCLVVTFVPVLFDYIVKAFAELFKDQTIILT